MKENDAKSIDLFSKALGNYRASGASRPKTLILFEPQLAITTGEHLAIHITLKLSGLAVMTWPKMWFHSVKNIISRFMPPVYPRWHESTRSLRPGLMEPDGPKTN